MHSLNLMLPKEDRRALLLRLFDDDTPLINTTAKREAAINARDTEDQEQVDIDTEEPIERSETEGPFVEDNANDTLPSKEEEDAIKRDNLVLGQEEQDVTNERETYGRAGDEEDVMNTTV